MQLRGIWETDTQRIIRSTQKPSLGWEFPLSSHQLLAPSVHHLNRPRASRRSRSIRRVPGEVHRVAGRVELSMTLRDPRGHWRRLELSVRVWTQSFPSDQEASVRPGCPTDVQHRWDKIDHVEQRAVNCETWGCPSKEGR